MTYQQIIKDIKNKVYHPVYCLMGEEPYYIDVISDYISENVLDEGEKEFNQSVLYGRDTDVQTIIDAAKRFPMMANYQVIIIKEAQHLKNINDLASYLRSPQKSTILVLCHKYKKLDKRKEVAKLISKQGVLFESKKLYDNQVPDWIGGFVKSKGYGIETKATYLLTEYLGADLAKISNELTKLMLNIPKGTEINAMHIEQNVGISKDYNNFELQKALGKKDVVKANQIVNYFAHNGKAHPLVVTISTLYSYYSKIFTYHFIPDKSKNNVASILRINPYFVKDYEIAAKYYSPKKVASIISHLRTYDLKSKGVGNATASEGSLLKELVYHILH